MIDHPRGFALTEAIAIIALLAVLFGLLIPITSCGDRSEDDRAQRPVEPDVPDPPAPPAAPEAPAPAEATQQEAAERTGASPQGPSTLQMNRWRADNRNNMRQLLLAFLSEAATNPRALTHQRIVGDEGDDAERVRRRFTYLAGRPVDPVPTDTLVNPVGGDRPREDAAGLWPGEHPDSPEGDLLESDQISYALIHHQSITWQNATTSSTEPFIVDKQVGRGSHWNEQRWEGHVGWADGRVVWASGPEVTAHFRDDRRRDNYPLFDPPAGAPEHNFLVNPR